MRTIVFTPEAARELDALDTAVRRRVEDALDALALDPRCPSFWLSRTGGRSTARRSELNKSVQIIVSPSGERLAVIPEDEYLALLAASEDDEGDPTPEFLEELDRRRQRLTESGHSIPFDQLRSDRR